MQEPAEAALGYGLISMLKRAACAIPAALSIETRQLRAQSPSAAFSSNILLSGGQDQLSDRIAIVHTM